MRSPTKRSYHKSRKPPPVEADKVVAVRLQRDLVDALNKVMFDLPVGATRPEGIRFILRDWLVGHGFLPAPPE